MDIRDEWFDFQRLPPVSVQKAEEFIKQIREGKSQHFQLIKPDRRRCYDSNINNRPEITHNPQDIHYYATRRRECVYLSVPVSEDRPNVIHAECLDIKVKTLDDLQDLRTDMLSKPFIVELHFEAERCSGSIIYKMPLQCLVATVNPFNRHMRSSLTKAFDEAEEKMQDGNQSFCIEIDLKQGLMEWYRKSLLACTEKTWLIPTIHGRWHLSIYNRSSRVIFLPNNWAFVLSVFSFPLWGPVYSCYKYHRSRTCHTIELNIDDEPCHNEMIL